MRSLPLLCVLLALLVAPFADFARAQDAAEDALSELLSPGESEEAGGAAEEGAGSIDAESSPRDDEEIRQRLLGIYGALDALDRLEVSVASGVVTLGGTSDSAAAAERAVAIAGQVDGVIEVLDESAVDTDVGRRLKATLERLGDGALAALAALPVLLLALAVVALFWWLGRLVGARRALFRSVAPNGFIAELLGGLARIAVILLGVFFALSLLDATSIIGTVLGAAGIVGLAVGFAVRDTVENYIASILLSLRTPFLARDYVRIDEHEGHVARLTSRATVLISLDGNHIRIPNSTVYKAIIVNYTRDPARRFAFTVGVDTDLSLEEAQQVALDAVHSVGGVLDDPPAKVIVAELGDSNVSLEVLAWVDQRESDFFKTRGVAIREVKQAFDAAGIVMPEPIYRVKVGSPLANAFADASDAQGGASEERTAERPAAARRPSPAGTAPTDASDTSPDRSIAVTLEREIDDPDSENLLDGSRPRE